MEDRTNRGFRIFGRVEYQGPRGVETIRLQESSLACDGAHVRVIMEAECIDHMGDHMHPDPELNVKQAEQLIAALQTFVDEAKADKLMEPAEVEER